jgi:hypothetical protein
VNCRGTGHDGELQAGATWPEPRFELHDKLVLDRLTGLIWPAHADLADFPLSWPEALEFVDQLNHEGFLDHADWRLPNRAELRSLLCHHSKSPALPRDHPFQGVALTWYWTSTSAAINPAYAWYVHMDGARMFYGRKDQYFLVWPVRAGDSKTLPRTGQTACHDQQGRPIPCPKSGQDADIAFGAGWPAPRFATQGEVVRDQLTGLIWARTADLTREAVTWQQALDAVCAMAGDKAWGRADWRLPNINELLSLVDCSHHSPALPAEHPFIQVQDGYWSSTTSFFEPSWAWALYLFKGAQGVGFKTTKDFQVWPVAGP